MIPYTVKSLPNHDVVQTEARLARGCEQRTLRGAAGFSRQRCVLVMSVDEVGAIRESSAIKIGAQRGESLDCWGKG
jgi:hypothetical protein